MTTKHKSSFKKFFLVLFSIFLFCSVINAEDSSKSKSKWVIGAEKFSYTSAFKEDEAVVEGITQMFPNRIMEKLDEDWTHIEYPDERLEQTLYTLRKERLSLFLQLSSEHKKRDSLILQNYSKAKLKSKVREADKAISEIQKKISENLKLVDEAMQRYTKEEKDRQSGLFNMDDRSESKNFGKMFRNMFSKNAVLISERDISFYKDDQLAFFQPSEKAKKAGYQSFDYEKEIVSAGINSLITGSVTNYGDYYFVTVDVYDYPGGKINRSVSEVGKIEDADFISASLAHQIVITLTNGMPVEVNFTINPIEVRHKVRIYFDDVLQPPDMTHLMTESGVHAVKFVCDGYKDMGTSYFFEGNNLYTIEVNMELQTEYYINVVNLLPFEGTFYAAGLQAESVEDELSHARIKINDAQILGQFISEEGYTTNYYVPKTFLVDENTVALKSHNFDANDYIDKRRRYMYGTYTLLMISMIPYFYTYGNYYNAANLYNKGLGDYDDALAWQTRNQICGGIAIGCGALFVYELVRYLVAANSVLPVKTKTVSPKKLERKREYARKKRLKMEEQAQKEAENSGEEAADVPEATEDNTEITDVETQETGEK